MQTCIYVWDFFFFAGRYGFRSTYFRGKKAMKNGWGGSTASRCTLLRVYPQKINFTAIFSTSRTWSNPLLWGKFSTIFQAHTANSLNFTPNRYSKEHQSAMQPFGSLSPSDREKNENCPPLDGFSSKMGPNRGFFNFTGLNGKFILLKTLICKGNKVLQHSFQAGEPRKSQRN